MGKQLRRVERKLQARIKACVEARVIAVRRNSKLEKSIDKALKLPGSRKSN